MSLVATWIGVSVGLGVLMRHVGPWWRVALGCTSWPAWPAAICISYIKFKIRSSVNKKRRS